MVVLVEVIGVVDGDRARGGADGERRSPPPSPSVLPFVMDQVRLAVLVDTVTTAVLSRPTRRGSPRCR